MSETRQAVAQVPSGVDAGALAVLAEYAQLFDEIRSSIKSVQSNYTITDNDHVILVDAQFGNRLVSLPSAKDHPNRHFIIKKIDTTGFKVTLSRLGADTIDGSAAGWDLIANSQDSVTIQSDGVSDWAVISHYLDESVTSRFPAGVGGGSTDALVHLGWN